MHPACANEDDIAFTHLNIFNLLCGTEIVGCRHILRAKEINAPHAWYVQQNPAPQDRRCFVDGPDQYPTPVTFVLKNALRMPVHPAALGYVIKGIDVCARMPAH